MKEISITVLIVRIAAVGSIFIVASVFASITPPPQYELICRTDSMIYLTGAISPMYRTTAETILVDEVVFILNCSSVDDPSIWERGDIRVVVGNYGLRFNLTRRLEGNYACGRRVNVANMEESWPLTLASLQTTIPLPDPPPQTKFTAVSGDRVVLPCPIQPGALIQYYSVIWSIENNIVVRHNIVTADDSRYNIDRATYSLIIDPVNINDTSTRYGCALYVIDPCTAIWHPLHSSPPVSLSLHVINLPAMDPPATNSPTTNPSTTDPPITDSPTTDPPTTPITGGNLSRRHLGLRVRLMRVSKDSPTTTSAVPTVNDTCIP